MKTADQLKALEAYTPGDAIFLRGARIELTPAAKDAMLRYEVDWVTLTRAHAAGDWGAAPEATVAANRAALQAAHDGPLTLPSSVESMFQIRDTTFVVRTQWTRSGNFTSISTL